MLDKEFKKAKEQLAAAMAQIAEEEAIVSSHSPLSAKGEGQRAALGAKEASDQLLQRLQKGLDLFLLEMERLAESEREILRQQLLAASNVQLSAILLEESAEMRPKLYEIAKNLLNEMRWQEAADAFYFLILLGPDTATFWLGLGISEQERQNLEEAMLAYAQAIHLDSALPFPYLYIAECQLALGDDEGANCACRRWKSY